MKVGPKCPTCHSRNVIRKGTTPAGVQQYQCRNAACPHPYFRARYYQPMFETHAEYVAHWRRRKQRHLKVHHRSLTVEWETPQDFFDKLNAEFHFTLDVSADTKNAKCARYYTREDNALTQLWDGVCWCNPPYGEGLSLWLAKAYASAQAGATVVCLLPARTERSWWHDYAMQGEVRFVRKRLTFKGATHPAPFPSVIVIFRPPHDRRDAPLTSRPALHQHGPG